MGKGCKRKQEKYNQNDKSRLLFMVKDLNKNLETNFLGNLKVKIVF
jgi:hypothetical protein